MAESQLFQALLLSLPTGNSTLRMRLWRALKSTGCGVLRDGVYVLPDDAPQASTFTDVAADVKAAGGFAMNAELRIEGAAELAQVRQLFDRSAEYAELVDRIARARSGLRRLGERKAKTAIQRLRRSLDELAAIDFFAGEAQRQAHDALASLEADSQSLFAHGEPHASGARVRELDPARYRARTWATRKAPWVDRLASAWLIKRFIDRDAKFVWIERPRDCPKNAIGFDFDGARFTHAGHRVTYEVLVASFGLAHDAALAEIGRAVHFLDIGGIAVADAKGLETLLTGIREKARSDDEMTRDAARIFDLLYAAYSRSSDEPRG